MQLETPGEHALGTLEEINSIFLKLMNQSIKCTQNDSPTVNNHFAIRLMVVETLPWDKIMLYLGVKQNNWALDHSS